MRQKNKKIVMKTTAVSLGSILCMGSAFPVWAAEDYTKDENVYVMLEEDGNVSDVYVVNEFTSDKECNVTDYGDYSKIKNLSTEEKLKQNKDEVKLNLTKGKFYYQGTVEPKEIPWEIEIVYTLDGKKMEAKKLAGKSGHLVIQMKVSENTACEGDFFDNYLLQGTVTLNTEKCSNIVADGATAANVGKNRQLLYNIMAGQEKEIEISADVEDFEMDGITFQGVPMAFDVNKDMVDSSELTDQTSKIKDAVEKLDDGAGELKDGTKDAADGSKSLLDGTGELKDGIGTLASGQVSLLSGAGTLQNGISSLNEGIGNYTSGTSSLAEGIKAYLSGVDQLSDGAKQLESLEQLGQVSSAIQTLSAKVGGKEENTLLSGSKSLSAGLKELQAQVNQMAASTDNSSLQEMTSKLTELKTSLETLSAQSESLGQMLSADAQAATALVEEQQQVYQSLLAQSEKVNEQILQKNQELQSQAQSVNDKIDAAIAAIDAVKNVENGMDTETAETLKENLEASKVTVQDVEVTDSITMPQQAEEMKTQIAMLSQSAEQISNASKGFAGAANEFSQAAKSIQVSDSSMQGIKQLQEALASACKGAEALEDGVGQTADGLKTLEEQTKQLPQAATGVKQLNEGFATLTDKNEQLLSGANQLISSKNTLEKGSQDVLSGANQLKNGIKSTSDGVTTLQSGSISLYNAVGQLSDGLKSLEEGSSELKDGTEEFSLETNDIDTKVDDAIDDMIDKISGSDYEPVSFASDENENIGLVQFAIRTDDIKVKTEEKEETTKKKETILEKIKHLF